MASEPAENEHALSSGALALTRIRWAVTWGVVVVLLLAFAALTFGYGSAGSGVACLVFTLVLVVAWWIGSALLVRSYRWLLTDGSLELRHGVIVRRHSVLPRSGIQNVTVSSGPIARWMGLATVKVRSAGVDTPNITIPDLDADVAEDLRAALLPQVIAVG